MNADDPIQDDQMQPEPRHRGRGEQRCSNSAISPRLILGLLITALGAIYLAGNLGLIDISAPLRYFWPAACSAIGLALLISPGPRSSKWWGALWLVVGAWTLAYQAHWIAVDFWKLAFPLVLLAVGARLVQHSLHGPAEPAASAAGAPLRVFAVLSGNQVQSFTQPIDDVEVVSLLSGVKLDLSQAQLAGERATLQVTAVMGGIEIYAPSEWTVVNKVTPILGAFVDHRQPATASGTQTLVISGVVVMGGVEVKN